MKGEIMFGTSDTGVAQLLFFQGKEKLRSLIKTSTNSTSNAPLKLKPVEYRDGVHHIEWMTAKFEELIVKENLQYAIVGKFYMVDQSWWI